MINRTGCALVDIILAQHEPGELLEVCVGLAGWLAARPHTKRKTKTERRPPRARQGHREIRESVKLFSFHAAATRRRRRRPWSTKSGVEQRSCRVVKRLHRQQRVMV